MKPAEDALALALILEGLRLLSGAALGIVVGVNLRRWGLVVPSGSHKPDPVSDC